MRPMTLFALLATAGCAAHNDRPARFDATTIAAAQPGDPVSLLRYADYTPPAPGRPSLLDGVEQINGIALTQGSLLIAANWSGIYRIPKHGGAVSVVQEGGSSEYSFLAANADTIFWDDDDFGPQDQPGGTIRSRPAAGGDARALAPIDRGMLTSGDPTFVADGRYLYYVMEHDDKTFGDFDLRRVPVAGGASEVVFSKIGPGSGVSAPETAFGLNFVAAGGDAYCVGNLGREIDVVPAGANKAHKLADLPAEDSGHLRAVDGDTLYVAGDAHVYALPRAGGPLKTLFTSADKKVVSLLAVDDKNAYLAYEGAIWSMPKTGGSLTRISRDGVAMALDPRAQQDDDYLYFTRNNAEVVMLPKAPAQPIMAQ